MHPPIMAAKTQAQILCFVLAVRLPDIPLPVPLEGPNPESILTAHLRSNQVLHETMLRESIDILSGNVAE